MRVLLLALGLVGAVAIATILPVSVSADSAPPDSRHLIAMDTFAVGLSEIDASVARSSIRNIANAQPGVDLTLMRYGVVPGTFARFDYGSS